MADPLATPTLAPAATTAPSVTGVAPTTNPVSAYMNPYTSDVLDSAIKNMNDSATQAKNTLGTQAFQAGAYGDGRMGVEDANIDTGLEKNIGDLTASTNAGDYTQAMQWLGQDIDRGIGTSEFNANLDNTDTSNQLAELGLGNSLEQNSLTQGQNYATALDNLNTSDQAGTQQQDNVDYQNWLDQQGYGETQLQQLISTLSGTPGQASTSSSSTSSTPNNSWAALLASALSGLNTSSLFGGATGAAGSMAANPTGL